MMEKFAEKMIQNALSNYVPKLKETSAIRADELSSMKAKVRKNPEEVEAWFEKEIDRARSQFNDVLQNLFK